MRNLRQKSELEKSNFRYNVITTICYVIGIIILIQLFNLQIVHGAEYRENSNTRLSREGIIEAARGNISDRTGNVLVSTDLGFSVEMYKTNVENSVLNNSILTMTNILKQNGDEYINPFPIMINPYGFVFETEEELAEWRKVYKIPETASAEEAFYLFRDKYEIKSNDPDEILQILAIRYAITTMGYSTTKSIKIAESISAESAVQLQEQSQDLTGVSVTQEPIRKYHTGTLASHIIGYVQTIRKENIDEFKSNGDEHEYKNTDKVGQTGIEKVFEEYLRGEDGANVEKIRNGGFSQVYDANGASVVVMNVNSGEVLAMASYPDYNPEEFYIGGISNSRWAELNDSIKAPLHNRAIQSTYAPGSTFKMVTAVAALESGVVGVKETINDNGPFYVADDYQPACWIYNDYGHGHGRLNVSGAIEKSCNYFFFEVSSRMGIDTLEKYTRFFGLGSKTGIELSGEKKGTVANRSDFEAKTGNKWTLGYTVSAAIGQGENDFTPIQMARYISMIANGGQKINVSIVKDIILSNGTYVARSEIENFTKQKLNLQDDTSENFQISEQTKKAVLDGMLSVTDDQGGTAYSVFQDFNIRVGGKTGSAEVGNKVNAWFVGFAPFDAPEIAVVVNVENGGHGFYTAEVVRDLIAEYFGMNVQTVIENMTANSEIEMFR